MAPKVRRKVPLCGGELGALSSSDRGEDIGELSKDESMYSLSADILPSLGATARKSKFKLRSFVISPFDHHYRAWTSFLVLLVFYTAWVSPFEFGFLDKPIQPLSITDNTVNGLFAIDIVLTFFVAYMDQASYLLIDDRRLIALKYAKTWLIFDVISTIPYEVAYSLFPHPFSSYGLFSMLRLWRLRRASNMFARLEKDKNYSYFWVRCLKLICVSVFAMHFAGCIFYYLAAHYKDPSKTWIASSIEDLHATSLWDRYVTSMYYSIATLTTIGYGDLHPVNTQEMLVGIFYMLFVLGLQSYLIGNMTNMVVHGTSRTREFRDTIKAASSFGKRNQLPVRLQDQIVAHLYLRYRTDSEGLQQQETINTLPKAIRTSISHFLFYSLLDKVYLFRGVSNDLLVQLVSEMKAEYFPPDEDVILKNEAPTEMYIFVTGSADLIVQRSGIEQVVGEARSGDIVGEIGVLCYRPQMYTVRVRRLSQLLRLNRTSFLSIVQANVGDGTVILNNLFQHLKEVRDPIGEETLSDAEFILSYGKTDLPVTLWFAAMRGDDLLLQKLLKRGADPNELDNNGRTAMHIAASKGNEHCVVLLLEHGANPNSRDLEGNVPLWEAIQGHYEHVIKILVDNGAVMSSRDSGNYACFAVDQNNLDLLKDIVKHGGDVTAPKSKNGTTALHVAISAGSVEMVRFLMEQGANGHAADDHGLTPKALADHLGNEEVKTLLESRAVPEGQRLHISTVPNKRSPSGVSYSHGSTDALSPTAEPPLGDRSGRRRASNFENSLFGFMSGHTAGDQVTFDSFRNHGTMSPLASSGAPWRVTISCPEQAGESSKVIGLPKQLQELFEIGAVKFGMRPTPTRILTSDGAEIDDIDLIRDGDHLLLLTDAAFQQRLNTTPQIR